MPTIHPVILSGGSGTRLWPLSRARYPKQFVRFFQEQDNSFLGATLRRLDHDGFEAPTLLCNNDHRFLVQDEVQRAAITPRALILEPVVRNTAPALAIAALDIAGTDPEAVMVVLPSDHIIGDESAFRAAVNCAAGLAETGRFVLFGIRPSEPHTGYGYIKLGKAIPTAATSAYAVKRFVEKPDLETAQRYLAEGEYSWNSGIFVLPCGAFIEELERLQPALLAAARRALAGSTADLSFRRLDRAAYAEAPRISVDYAVMEKTDRAAVLPIDVGWNDVGSWSSLWEIASRDGAGNHTEGEALLEDTRDTFVYSDRALVSTIGVDNLVIVNTPDALLVADKERAQDVSKIVQTLKDQGRSEYAQHIRDYRRWGYVETLATGPRFQVNRLHVRPGAKLSMQMHHHRSEHWVVVQGTARITVDGAERLLRENESVYISATQQHQLENPGIVPVEIIEVQTGSYLGEDDIVRGDDLDNPGPVEAQ